MFLSLDFIQDIAILRLQRQRTVNNDHQQIGIGGHPLCAQNSYGLNLVLRLPDACSIDQQRGDPTQAQRLAYGVPCSTRKGSYDGSRSPQ